MEKDLGFLLCLEAVASGAAAVPAPGLPAVHPGGQMCWEGSAVHDGGAGRDALELDTLCIDNWQTVKLKYFKVVRSGI